MTFLTDGVNPLTILKTENLKRNGVVSRSGFCVSVVSSGFYTNIVSIKLQFWCFPGCLGLDNYKLKWWNLWCIVPT